MFTNSDVSIDNLPTVDEQNFNQLNEKYRIVSILNKAIFALILASGYLYLYFNIDSEAEFLLIPVLGILLILIGILFYVAYFGFEKKKYKLRQNDIIFRQGLWWTSETSVPFVRVQHSEVIQGPIERIFGLSKLKLYTAGGHSSDLSIPGLKPKKAEKLKEFITKKLVAEDENKNQDAIEQESTYNG